MSLTGEERAAAIRLASLPAMSPTRLRILLKSGRPLQVERLLLASNWSTDAPTMVRTLLQMTVRSNRMSGPRSRAHDVADHTGRVLHSLWREHLERMLQSSGTLAPEPPVAAEETPSAKVVMLGDEDYPPHLATDPSAPALLFVRGSLDSLGNRRVGIVGTRHATSYGRSTAFAFGRMLAENGVGVVSGLARGIDASAHRGALSDEDPKDHRGRPIAVVASGLDVVYPPEHAALWERVARDGLLLSEAPPGTAPVSYRFPWRNRVIAALSEVLVVVESRIDGGSMITVRHALRRGVTVMAVPGSTSTPASEGTNLLLRDGALVAVCPDDVLAALALDTRRRLPFAELRPLPLGADAEVLALFDTEPVTLDDLVARDATSSGLGLARVAVSLGHLHAHGWISCTDGWFERLDGPLD
ncbi:MAG: DNA-processing protein DprA [Ilumatobacteraceae bacterium]